MTLISWLLAAVGSTVILTHGSIFAPLRERIPEGKWHTLVTCPMCAGFWFGVFWSLTLGSPAAAPTLDLSILAHALAPHASAPFRRTASVFADACASSLASHLYVTLWLLVSQATTAMRELELKSNYDRYVASLARHLPSTSDDPPLPSTSDDSS
jgi:hypothetical protein